MNRRSAESTLVIVQPGEKLPTLQSVPGDFADWIIDGLARADLPVRIVRPHRGDTLPAEADVAAVVVTGSSSMVTDRDPWMQASADWLRRLVEREVPVLGICFGHQLLAYALGGNVQDNPNGIEVGTVVTQLHPEAHSDPLFGGLPEALSVQASHRQAVTGLPANAAILAASDKDSHHAFRVGKNAWGVQFHPEFDARIVTAYAEYYAPALAEQGVAAAQSLARIRETPQVKAILARFGRMIGTWVLP